MSRSCPRWLQIAILLLVVSAAVGLVAAGGMGSPSEPSGQDPNDLESPAQNADRIVEFVFFGGSTTVRFDLTIWYPARSAAEAQAARTESLDPDWFDPTERVRAIQNRTGAANETLDAGSVSAQYAESRPGESPSDPEHGWVMVTRSISWENYLDDGGEDVSVGRNHTEPFGPGWNPRVSMPEDWEPATLNGDPAVRGGKGELEYRWTLEEDTPDPLIAVDESNVTTRVETSEQPVGIAGGLLLGVVALAAVRRYSPRDSGDEAVGPSSRVWRPAPSSGVPGATAHRIRSSQFRYARSSASRSWLPPAPRRRFPRRRPGAVGPLDLSVLTGSGDVPQSHAGSHVRLRYEPLWPEELRQVDAFDLLGFGYATWHSPTGLY